MHSILSKQQASINSPMFPLWHSFSNYHSPLNACTTLFTIRINCKMILFYLQFIACFAYFPSKFRNNVLGGFVTLLYSHNFLYWTGISIGIPNRQRFLYIGIFMLIIFSVVLSYFYENSYISYYKINEFTYVGHITQIVKRFGIS